MSDGRYEVVNKTAKLIAGLVVSTLSVLFFVILSTHSSLAAPATAFFDGTAGAPQFNPDSSTTFTIISTSFTPANNDNYRSIAFSYDAVNNNFTGIEVVVYINGVERGRNIFSGVNGVWSHSTMTSSLTTLTRGTSYSLIVTFRRSGPYYSSGWSMDLGNFAIEGIIDGACSNPLAYYNCWSGMSTNNVDGPTAWTWNCNSTTGGTNASCSQPKPYVPPTAPTYLRVNNSDFGSDNPFVELMWMDNASNETNYRIYRSVNGSAYANIATIGANSFYYDDWTAPVPLTSGTIIKYLVSAYNSSSGLEGYSPELTYPNGCLANLYFLPEGYLYVTPSSGSPRYLTWNPLQPDTYYVPNPYGYEFRGSLNVEAGSNSGMFPESACYTYPLDWTNMTCSADGQVFSFGPNPRQYGSTATVSYPGGFTHLSDMSLLSYTGTITLAGVPTTPPGGICTATRWVEVMTAPLTNGLCGASWTNLGQISGSSVAGVGTTSLAPYSLSTNTCYKFTAVTKIGTHPTSSPLPSTNIGPERKVDYTLPTTSDDWFDGWTTQGRVDVFVTASDNGAGVNKFYWCIDTGNSCNPLSGSYYSNIVTNPVPNPQTAAMSVITASGIANTQYLRYVATDYSGNVSAIGSKRVRQDLALPSTPGACSIVPSPSSGVHIITWGASSDSGSGIMGYYIYENGSYVALTLGALTQTVLSGRSPGTYNYQIYSRDSAGNYSASPSACSVVVNSADSTPPTVTVSVNPNPTGLPNRSYGTNIDGLDSAVAGSIRNSTNGNQPSLTITCSDSGSGCVTMNCSNVKGYLNGVSALSWSALGFSSCTPSGNNLTLSISGASNNNGNRKIDLNSLVSDVAGNKAIGEATFLVDNKAPTIVIH